MRKKHIRLLLLSCVFLFVFILGCTKKQSSDYAFWGKGLDSFNKSRTDKFWQKTRSRSNLVDAYKRLGGFYQKQGKHRKAIAEFIKAIKAKTDDINVYNSLAMSYDALKEYKYAEMAYKDAIAMAPEQPYLYNNYGCSSLLRGDIDAAVTLFEKATSLDTESRRIKNNLSLAIYRSNKNEMLHRDNQETTQLPGLYVTERKLADNNELKTEAGYSDMVASVSSDEAVATVEVEAVARPIVVNIEEPVKEVALIEPAEIQPEVEETAAMKVLEENVSETAVAEKIQVEEEITEIQPVLVEDVVTKTVEVVEEVQADSETPAEVVESSIDETVPAESTPAQVVTDDRNETTSIAAISSDDETNWYNDLIVSVLAALGFENDGKTVDVLPSVESEQPAVVLTNNDLTDEDTASLDNKVEVQEKVVEKSIVDTAVTGNEQQKILTVIQEQPEENGAELPTVKNVENKPVESEAVETVAVSTFEVPEPTMEPAVGETKGEIFEAVSTEDDAVDEEVAATVHAANTNTDPDSVKEDVVVTAQADEAPEIVNEIIVDTKAAGIIQVKALMVADSMKDDISSKSYAPVAEAQVPTLYGASSVKKKVVAVTDNGQNALSNQRVAVEVSNGNGVEGMATRSAAYFREQGEYIRRITNASHFGFKDSIVFYREGYLQEAYKIALMVPGYQEMKQVESLGRPEISVRLLLGKDMAPLRFPESMTGISPKQISNYGQNVTMVDR